MSEIHKKIVLDEAQHPVAVQIDYADWLDIERRLGLQLLTPKAIDPQEYVGVIRLPEDPLEYQRRIREEWS